VEDLKVVVHPGKLDVLVLLQDLLVAVHLAKRDNEKPRTENLSVKYSEDVCLF
jgi:hypothetical protein